MPYGLDVWGDNHKVLSVTLNDDHVEVVSYKPGDWELRLRRIASVAS